MPLPTRSVFLLVGSVGGCALRKAGERSLAVFLPRIQRPLDAGSRSKEPGRSCESHLSMQCSCERDALLRALTICADLCRAFPDLSVATLHAHQSAEACAGTLEVSLWSERCGLGTLARLPATLTEPGEVTVPSHLMAQVLAALPQNPIRLSSVVIPASDPEDTTDLLQLLRAGPALQIETIGQSRRAPVTRVRLRPPIVEPAASPWLSDGQTRGVPLATITPRALREVLDPCLLLARERDVASASTPDMDRALVLLHFAPEELICTATTRMAVAQSRVPWRLVPEPAPIPSLLLDERMLQWVRSALKRETEPVTLTVVPQEGPSALLLISLVQGGTLVCRGKTAPIPLIWERRVDNPASQVFLVSRPLLAQALAFLSVDRAGYADRYLQCRVANQQLCLQWYPPGPSEPVATCPIVNTVADCSPFLIHLGHMRRMVRRIKGPVIYLEQGVIMPRRSRETSAASAPVSFMRFSMPTSLAARFMVALAEHPSQQARTDLPARSHPERSDGDGSRAALAPT